jgi:hypothetical protein
LLVDADIHVAPPCGSAERDGMPSLMKVAMKSWLKNTEDGFTLTLHVQPGAKKTEVCGEHGAALKIRLAAPPVEGKANDALIAWLSDRFDLPKRHVTLLSGEKNRHKLVFVARVADESAILSILGLDR